jgi:SAM-dependent methyltransferase
MRRAAWRALERLGVLAWVGDLRARLRYIRSRELRERNASLTTAPTADGYPLPPPELVYAVAGHFDLDLYVRSGADHAEFIRDRVSAAGLDLDRARALLEFGCGCGRVLRRWHTLTSARVCGCDVNPRLVAWCQGALPFAEVTTNGLEPPLPYADDTFDVIYAISVLTHLPGSLQERWMRELERVLAPGGVALVTTKGASRSDALTAAERERFEAGQFVVQASRYAGRNLCAAFNPERDIRERLSGDLEVVEFVPADGAVFTQDATVFRKRAAPATSARAQ